MRKHLTIAMILYSTLSFADAPMVTEPGIVMPSNPSATPVAQPAVSNQVTVAVLDRSAAALNLSLQSAFSEIMQNLSGNPQIMTNPAIQKASANAVQWVQSYAYVQQPVTNPQLPPALTLQVVFDVEGLQQLLKTATQKPTTKTVATASSVIVVVTGIASIDDYVEIMRELRAMPGVVHVTAKNVETDRVTLDVKTTQAPLQFQDALSSNMHFRLDSAEDVPQTNPMVLQYRWIER